MDLQQHPIDEYTLAAFLAGTLSNERRAEVAAYLAHNEDARELLQMAHEALESAKRSDEPLVLPAAPARQPAPPARTGDRPARQPAMPGLHTMRRFGALAVLLVGVGLGLRLGFGPPTDALRSGNGTETAAVLTIEEASPLQLDFSWSTVPDADHYRLVVFDPAATQVVDRVQTSATQLTEAEAITLRDHLATGRVYTIRVDAYNAQNRLLQSSDSYEFTYQP